MSTEEKMIMAKAWCFDNGISLEDIENAWDKAIKENCFVVKNLDKNGYKWWWLGDNPKLLSQLMERYGKKW